MFVSFNPQEPTNWRAVCGKTARTVRREGSRKSMRLSYPYLLDVDAARSFWHWLECEFDLRACSAPSVQHPSLLTENTALHSSSDSSHNQSRRLLMVVFSGNVQMPEDKLTNVIEKLGDCRTPSTKAVSAYRFERTAFVKVDIVRDCDGSFADFNLIQ